MTNMRFDTSHAALDESMTAEMTAALSAMRRPSPRGPACAWRLTPDGRLACTWGPISAPRPRFPGEPLPLEAPAANETRAALYHA